MAIMELQATKREEKGSVACGKLRREGVLPGVIYSKDEEPVSVKMDRKVFTKATHGATGNLILNINVDGKKTTTLLKATTRDPIKNVITHADFQKVSLKDKITASIPVHLVGEPAGVKLGGIIQHNVWEVEIKASAQDLPEGIDADISALNIGDALHAGELQLAEGTELLSSPDLVIASILGPTLAMVEEAAEEAAAAAASAEPEVIGKGKEEASEG